MIRGTGKVKLVFSGKVTIGDRYRVGFCDQIGSIHIGGVDLVDEIAEHAWVGDVSVVLNGQEIANGRAISEMGWGYSEYTPVDSDVAKVGECDLIEKLEALEGESVVLVIEDGK